jgi:hypothetical protein
MRGPMPGTSRISSRVAEFRSMWTKRLWVELGALLPGEPGAEECVVRRGREERARGHELLGQLRGHVRQRGDLGLGGGIGLQHTERLADLCLQRERQERGGGRGADDR